MGKPWAVYSRVSRVGDREDTLISPELQQQRAASYAASRKLPVAVLAPELDVSGGTINRPILSEAIEGVEDGRYAGIIVAQLDRLSRMDLADALRTIERIESAGGQVIAVAENFDAATPEGRLGRNVFLAMGQMQLDRYKLQFRASKARAVKHGIWPIPRVPYGYVKGEDRRLVPDPARAPTVVRAFEARADEQSWRQVAAILDVGLSNAGKIVRNRVYLGEIVYGEWMNLAAHEPLVTLDLWAAAQRDHPRPSRRPGEPPALLAGLVRCAGCQGRMTPSSTSKGRYIERTYRCIANKAGGRCTAAASISRPKLDGFVETLALEQIDRLAITAAERSDAVDGAQRALEAARAELVAYQEAARVADLGVEAFATGMRSRVGAVDEAQDVVARARTSIAPMEEPGTLRDLWPQLSVKERGHVLRGALSVVWVRRGRGPCEGRVRVIAAGHGPSNGSRARLTLEPLPWIDDIPGEIRPART